MKRGSIWDIVGAISFFILYTLFVGVIWNPDFLLFAIIINGVFATFLFMGKLWARVVVTLIVVWNLGVAFIELFSVGVLNSIIIKNIVFLLLLIVLIVGFVKAKK